MTAPHAKNRKTGQALSFRVPDEVLDEVARRYKAPGPGAREGGRSQAVRAALDRYYETCRRHFARLDFSQSELGLLCAVHNGGMLAFDFGDDRRASSMLAVSVWHELADTIEMHPGYGAQWDVSDEAARVLVVRLQAAPYADLVALVDFIERFWANDPEAQKVIYPDGATPA